MEIPEDDSGPELSEIEASLATLPSGEPEAVSADISRNDAQGRRTRWLVGSQRGCDRSFANKNGLKPAVTPGSIGTPRVRLLWNLATETFPCLGVLADGSFVLAASNHP